MAKFFTKRSRSKGNSLPSTKRIDFTMVDDYFEESQHGFAPKETNADTKKYVKFFKDSASARNHHCSSTIKMVASDILLADTALQLLEVVIHHGVIKPLGGWQAVAFRYEYAWKTWAFYANSRLGTNCKSATHNPCIQRLKLPAHF